MGSHPEGITSKRSRVSPVCVGTPHRGEWNNCAGNAEYVVLSTHGDALVALGVCERHVLRVKMWVATEVSDLGEVLITTPAGLDDVLKPDEQVFEIIPRAAAI